MRQISTSAAENFGNKIKIIHGLSTEEKPWALSDLGKMFNVGENQGDPVLSRLGAIQINTPRVSLCNKYTDAISIFMNGIPTIEMARAVPFIDMKFQFGRETIDANGRLNATSIFKFLEGAVNVSNGSPLSVLALSNRVSGAIEGARNDSGYLSVAGMELFTSPQTMVNANTPNPTGTSGDGDLRVTPVLDKFRPFATFKNLTIEVAPTIGLMSFKTAKMAFVLHDRSRLHEIADLLKPDLYGTTELIIEYGWSHPDPPNFGNPYAVLLNCTRIKEKYGIRNMSIGFDEVGQANIILDLFTRGVNEFATESIGTASERTQRSLQVIQRLAEAIRLLREKVFKNNSSGQNGNGGASKEIRGSQILESASDIENNIKISPELLNNLDEFEKSLKTSSSKPSVAKLLESLRSLYNARTSSKRISASDRSSGNNSGAVLELQRNIQNEIQEKLSKLKGTYDPFYPPKDFKLPGVEKSGNFPETAIGDLNAVNSNTTRFRRAARTKEAKRDPSSSQTQTRKIPTLDNTINAYDNTFFSLGKLLLAFIGQPLASHIDKFSSVQFLFYPFNAYAGYANGLNVSQFMVDTRYFIEQYVKFRTETINRAANVSLNEFMQFIANVIIDDPGAAIYGIDDLYEKTTNRSTGEIALEPKGDSVEHQTRLENRLRKITPDGSFRMPNISFYLEALPKRNVNIGESGDTQNLENFDDSQTILRIHVFDQQATQYEGQSALLAAARDNALNSIASIPSENASGEPAILQGHRVAIQEIIDMAKSQENIIEAIQPDPGIENSNPTPQYRIKGGGNAIKQFVMRTMPYIIYSAQGTNIINASIDSQNEPALSTVNMLRSTRANPLQPNGEQAGSLPLSIIPMEMSMTTMGCSLISFAQQMFVDCGTGTSLDNIFGVCGLTHKLEAGSFTTDIKFAPFDAYGRYDSFLGRINNFASNLSDINGSTNKNKL
jgi:hypothetical protein